MILLRLALALFCFVIEVRVKAKVVSLPTTLSPVQLPEGCAENAVFSAKCSVKTGKGEKWTVELPTGMIHLDQESAVSWDEEGRFVLLQGLVWAETNQPFLISTNYGHVHVNGVVWMRAEEQSPRRVVIGAIRGMAVVEGRAGWFLKVVEGTQNWVGQKVHRKPANVGIPQPLLMQEQINLWARLSESTKDEFRDQVREFFENWYYSVQKLSDQHLNLAKGEIDHKIATQKERRQRRADLRARQAKYRKLFRERNFMD